MPMLTMRASFAAKAYGALKGKSGVLPSGNLAMLFKGGPNTVHYKYVFANGAVSTTPSFTPSVAQPGFSNSSRGIVGQSSVNYQLWLWASETLSGLAAYGQTVLASGATGDLTKAYTAVGNNTVSTMVFTYSSGGVVSGPSFTIASNNGAALGSPTYGIFARGQGQPTTQKWTYATGGMLPSSNLTANLLRGAGAANTTKGVFAIANGTSVTNRWLFASDSVIVSGVLSITTNTSSFTKAAGNAVQVIFTVNAQSTSVYSYASETAGNGTALPTSLGTSGAAISNGVPGVSA